MKFLMFQDGPSGAFSFQLVDDSNNPLLNSPNYPDRDACTSAIRASIEAIREEGQITTTSNGDDSFIVLNDEGGNELMRSYSFDEREQAESSIEKMIQDANAVSDFEVSFSQTAPLVSLRAIGDVDYAKFYDFTMGSHSGEPGFDSYQSEKDEQFYFLFNDSQGQPILFSRSFPTMGKRDGRIRMIIKNAPHAKRYGRMESDGKPFFIIKATNGTEIGRSKTFGSEKEMDEAIAYLMAEAPTFAAKYPAPEKRKRTVNEYDLSQPSTSGEKGFDAFRSEKNKLYYFHFNNDQGEPLLFSESYSSSRSRNNGIATVIRNSVIRERFEVKDDGDQKYVSLKAGNRQEISRSKNLATQTEAEELIEYFFQNIPSYAEEFNVSLPQTETFNINIGSNNRAMMGGVTNAGGEEDYDLTQASPDGKPGFEAFFSDKHNQNYFHFNGADGTPLFFSEGYQVDKSRDNGIKSVIKNSVVEDHFAIKEDSNGKYFTLRAGNYQEIGRSRYFETDEELQEALAYFQRNAHKSADEYGVEVDVPDHLRDKAMARSLSASDDNDYDLTQPSTSGKGGFEAFKSDKHNAYYFHFNDENGDPYFYSEGYKVDKSRDNGIKSVIKNSLVDDHFAVKQDDQGWYYTLRAGNYQEIGRSKYFTSEEEAKESLGQLQKSAHQSAAEFGVEVEVPAHLQARSFAGGVSSGHGKDEYDLTQASTTGKAGFDPFFSDKHDAHFFHFNEKDGEPMFFSEGYTNDKGRDNGIASVIKNSVMEERFERREENGQHHFRLKAGNHQEIGRSKDYDSAEEMENSLAWFKATAAQYAKEYNVDLAAAAPFWGYASTAGLGSLYGKNGEKESFDTYYDPATGKYYWVYLDNEGKPLFVSPGYSSAGERDAAVKGAIDNIGNKDQYELVEGPDGWHYVLRDENGEIIAKSSAFDGKSEAEGKMDWLLSTAPALAFGGYSYDWATGTSSEPLSSGGDETTLDEDIALGAPNTYEGYLDLDSYNAQRDKSARGFDSWQDPKTGKFYWAYLDGDGNPFLVSQGFDTAEARDADARGIMDYVSEDGNYKLFKAPDGTFYYGLYDGDGKLLAKSAPFESSEKAKAKLSWLMAARPAFEWGEYALDWDSGQAESTSPILEKPTEIPTDTASPVDEEEERGRPWWLWLLLALLLLLLLFFLLRGCEGSPLYVGGAKNKKNIAKAENIPLGAMGTLNDALEGGFISEATWDSIVRGKLKRPISGWEDKVDFDALVSAGLITGSQADSVKRGLLDWNWMQMKPENSILGGLGGLIAAYNNGYISHETFQGLRDGTLDIDDLDLKEVLDLDKLVAGGIITADEAEKIRNGSMSWDDIKGKIMYGTPIIQLGGLGDLEKAFQDGIIDSLTYEGIKNGTISLDNFDWANKINMDAVVKAGYLSPLRAREIDSGLYAINWEDLSVTRVQSDSPTEGAIAEDTTVANVINTALPTFGPYEFQYKSSVIAKKDDDNLNKLAEFLKRNSKIKLNITGHTDGVGGDAYNLKLGQDRANAIVSRLTSLGVSPSQLSAKSLGKSDPRESNTTEFGQARNRRAETVLMRDK
ncbi:MAG: DUF1508 domain-containing protein [Bacteroidota bacterium]